MKNIAFLAALALAAAAPASGCEIPDDGPAPWRRAVAKVKYLPETEAWSERMSRERAAVQYVVLLDRPTHVGGRCYWPVEVRAGARLWRRFLVTPDGQGLLADMPR